MASTLIQVSNFSYRYNQETEVALKNIHLEVAAGEFVALIGANGSGKSTLCNALVGLIPNYFVGYSEGGIIVDEKDTSSVSVGELSQTIGLVFQNPFNQLSYTADSVAEELAYGLGNRGVPRDEMFSKIKKIAELMQIEDLLDKSPLELSGGQVQRVALASAIILEPKILVLDECTTQLDPLGSTQIMDIIKKLNENGVTIVMVDHDMERVAELADKVYVMQHGSIVLGGPPEEVFCSPHLTEFSVNPPDYYEITKTFIRHGSSERKFALTESQAIALLQEVVLYEDRNQEPQA